MLFLDTHAHLYPHYDFDRAFNAAYRNLAACAAQYGAKNSSYGIIIVERADCDSFADIASGKKILREWQIKKSSDAREVFLENVHGNRLLVMAGRQVATKERLELLALGTCGRIEDGLTLEASIVAAWQLHALPVICWSPGKWWFSRGTVVSRTVAKLRSVAPEKLLFLGDTALRPSGFPNIGLLAREQALKHVIFAGSDPLPFSGEEERLGRYGMGFTGAAPSSYLIDWIKENVALSANPTFTIGARLNSAAVLARLITLKRSRR